MVFEKFEDVNWHDSTIYSISFEDNLMMDIDFIIDSKSNNSSLIEFLIAPAKLEFYQVEHLIMNIKLDFLNGLQIDRVIKTRNSWRFELQEGEISFESANFKQTIIKDAIWTTNLNLSSEQRGKT